MMPEDLNNWYVRNMNGDMVPFSSFSTAEWIKGSPKLERFNGTSSINIQGGASQGVSTGAAMEIVQEIVDTLPEGFGIEWSGISYEERASGEQAPLLYALSILIVFLCLAALYESWSVPFAVILAAPLGVLGAALAAMFTNMLTGMGWANTYLYNDVYLQVAILTTVSVLDSQRELYTYQQNEIEIERQRLSNLVNLYKALGGGHVSKSKEEILQENESDQANI